MSERFFCADCKRVVSLDKHGLCELCGSPQVDTMERLPKAQKAEPDWVENAITGVGI